MASKIVKLAQMNQEEQKVALKNKLEIMKLKTKLIQEQLDLLESDLGQYHRPQSNNQPTTDNATTLHS